MMKKKVLYLMFALFSSFMIINKVSAYVMVDYSDGSLDSFQPVSSTYISYDVLSKSWGTDGTKLNLASSPILMSFNQYWYAGAVSGNHLSVHADYYVGFYSPGTYNNFLTNSRNILTSNNLRCAVGSYKEGYSNSYGSPQVSNFSVTFDKAIPPGGADGYNYLYHITFDYYQQIDTINTNSTNMSCWFDVNPSNALVGQIIYGKDFYSYFWYRNVSLKYSVSTDPNTEILGDISSSIDKTNDKLDDLTATQKDTNDKIDDLNDNITDETLPNTSGYGDVAGWLPGGTIDTLINLPLTFFTTINESASGVCKPYNLPFINNTNITLPCIGDYLVNLNGWGTLISFIDMAMSVILLYKLLMSLYKDIQKLMSLNNSDSDLGGVE